MTFTLFLIFLPWFTFKVWEKYSLALSFLEIIVLPLCLFFSDTSWCCSFQGPFILSGEATHLGFLSGIKKYRRPVSVRLTQYMLYVILCLVQSVGEEGKHISLLEAGTRRAKHKAWTAWDACTKHEFGRRVTKQVSTLDLFCSSSIEKRLLSLFFNCSFSRIQSEFAVSSHFSSCLLSERLLLDSVLESSFFLS